MCWQKSAANSWNGLDGVGLPCRGSLTLDSRWAWHCVYAVMCSQCYCLSLASKGLSVPAVLVQTMLWWLIWRHTSILCLIAFGITNLQPLTIKIVRWCQHGLHRSGNWDLWSGKPCRIIALRAWYSLNCLTFSLNSLSLTFVVSVLVMVQISEMDGSYVLMFIILR